MADKEALNVIEKIRNELILLAMKVKAGDITTTTGNAVANIYRTALYAEQVRAQQEKGLEVKLEQMGETELSGADRARLDRIAKLLEVSK